MEWGWKGMSEKHNRFSNVSLSVFSGGVKPSWTVKQPSSSGSPRLATRTPKVSRHPVGHSHYSGWVRNLKVTFGLGQCSFRWMGQLGMLVTTHTVLLRSIFYHDWVSPEVRGTSGNQSQCDDMVDSGRGVCSVSVEGGLFQCYQTTENAGSRRSDVYRPYALAWGMPCLWHYG